MPEAPPGALLREAVVKPLLRDSAAKPFARTSHSLVYRIPMPKGEEGKRSSSRGLIAAAAKRNAVGELCIKVRKKSSADDESFYGRALSNSSMVIGGVRGLFRNAGNCSYPMTPLLECGQVDIERAQNTLRYSYEVSPWVEGVTLRQWMDDQGGMRAAAKPADSFRERCEIVRAVAVALARLHDAIEYGPALVHGDVKPTNVILESCEPWRAVFVDHDTVRPLERTDEGTPARGCVEARAVRGTYAYAAPENILHGHADASSDVYSFGVLMHEVLTGRLPYPFASSRVRSLSFWRGFHVAGASYRIGKDLPEAVRDFVTSCLKFDPGERPLSAELPKLAADGLDLVEG